MTNSILQRGIGALPLPTDGRDQVAGGPTGSGLPGFGFGTNMGRALGGIGFGAGLATGASGLGLLGNLVGTGMDIYSGNQALRASGMPTMGPRAYFSGVLNNASFGGLGTPIGDSMIGSAVSPLENTSGGYGTGGGADSAYGGYGEGGSYGQSSSDVGGVTGSGGGFFNQGGMVTADRLGGPNPPGPDDGYAALDVGEHVIRADSARKLGPDILNRLNSGDFKRQAIAKALRGA